MVKKISLLKSLRSSKGYREIREATLRIIDTTTRMGVTNIPIAVFWKRGAESPLSIIDKTMVTIGCHQAKCQKLQTQTMNQMI